MEWERLDIMTKRLKVSDFSDYKLTQDFLTAANSLQPIWVTTKRMEICRAKDKTGIKFLEILTEFRQFWSLAEFESDNRTVALAASLQGLENPNNENINTQIDKKYDIPDNNSSRPKTCRCGVDHDGRDCYYLAQGKAPNGFTMDEKILKKFKDACRRPNFKTFVWKANWTSDWLKGYVNENWPASNQSNINKGTFTTLVGLTALTCRQNHPLRNEVLLDSGANGHVCNNLGLLSSELVVPVTPTFVESGSGTSPILGYANMTFNAHMGNGETFEMTITNVVFIPEYLTSVILWKLLKNKNVKWNTDSNILSYNGKLICKLLERHDHDVFTAEPILDNVRQIQNIQKNHSNLSVDNISNSLLSKLSNQETKSSPNGLINSIQPRKSVGSESLWHQHLGHPGPEALRHIQSETVKLEVKGPKTVDCKDCAINKAVKIIYLVENQIVLRLFLKESISI